jgi:hypothetical protein
MKQIKYTFYTRFFPAMVIRVGSNYNYVFLYFGLEDPDPGTKISSGSSSKKIIMQTDLVLLILLRGAKHPTLLKKKTLHC